MRLRINAKRDVLNEKVSAEVVKKKVDEILAKKHKTLEESCGVLATQKDDLADDIRVMRVEYYNLSEEIDKNEIISAELSSTIEFKNDNISVLSKNEIDLIHKNGELEKENNNLTETNRKLKEENAEIRKSNKEEREKIENETNEHEETIKNLKKDEELLQSSVFSLSARKSELDKLLPSLLQEEITKKEAVSSINSEIYILNDKKTILSSEVQAMEIKKGEIRDLLEEDTRKLVDTRQKIQKETTEFEDMKAGQNKGISVQTKILNDRKEKIDFYANKLLEEAARIDLKYQTTEIKSIIEILKTIPNA